LKQHPSGHLPAPCQNHQKQWVDEFAASHKHCQGDCDVTPVGGLAYSRQAENTQPRYKSLAKLADQVSSELRTRPPNSKALEPPCCPNPPNCSERVGWQARFKGCQTTFDDRGTTCEVAPRGARYWVADLDPLIMERSRIAGAQWNPYEHMRARQMWVQFAMADKRKDTDPYTKLVPNLDQTFCQQQAQNGPPRYTTF